MRSLSKWLPPVVLLLGMRHAPAAEPVPGYLPPDTKVLIGIQLRQIVDLVSQGAGAELRATSAAVLAQTPLAGFDPLKDLDEVLIASSGQGENPPAILILRGRFDVDRLAAKARRYQGVPVIEDSRNASGAIALLDASTAITGELPLVRAALDRIHQGATLDLPWAGRIAPLRAKYTVWGIGENIERPRSAKAQATPFDSVDRFEFGAELAHGLGLTAAFHVRSPEDAARLTASLAFVQAMLKGNSKSPNGSEFSITNDQATLRISLHIPEEELKKAVVSQKGAVQSALLSQWINRAAAPTKPAAPSEAKIVTNNDGETLSVTLPGARQ